MNKILKNKKIKNQKGAVSAVVIFTIFMFIVILLGVFTVVALKADAQLKSDMRIQELYGKDVDRIDDIYIIQEASLRDGYSIKKHVNSPKILTGMHPIRFDLPTEGSRGREIMTTIYDTEWYEYGTTQQTRKWANAETEDGSMWVWIPRYAYRIDEKNHEVDIKFLIGKTDYYFDDEGNLQKAQRANPNKLSINTKGINYTVHPAFTDESTIDYVNGGWDEELTGIWVAKFEPGFASGNNGVQVVESDEFYDNNNNNQAYVAAVERPRNQDGTLQGNGWNVARNWLDGIYGTEGSTNTSIKYPTFQPLTYSMNYITSSEAYRLSKGLTGNSNIYGLNITDTDSHLIKNSEWGAVAYLTQSVYGKNSEITINNVTLDSGGNPRTNTQGGVGVDSVYAVTGCTSNSTSAGKIITTIGSINNATGNTATSDGVYVWNQLNGQNASSSGTIYGIYDLSGGAWERTSAFASNGNEQLNLFGRVLKEETNTITGENGANTGTSTKYITVYPSNDSGITNRYTAFRANYKNYANNSSIYGDAMKEVTDAKAGSDTEVTGWSTSAGSIFGSEYKDFSRFPGYDYQLFGRGGCMEDTSSAGIYVFDAGQSNPSYRCGFRPVLISKVGGSIESNDVLDYTVLRGNQRKISIPYTGEEATITYQIENTNLATVDSNGVITASSTNTGTTNITLTITDNLGNVTTKTHTVTVEMGVARTNNKDFSSLQAAINDVPADNAQREITMLKNTTGSGGIKANQNIILNLNSKTITGVSNGNDFTIATRGKLVITGNGKITGSTIGIRCWKGGELQILNGTYEGTENAVRQTDTSTMTLDGGTYNSKVAIRCWGTTNSSTVINGGTYQGTENAIRIGDDTNLVINDGNFSATTNSALHTDSRASVKINKGVFNSNENANGDGVIQHYSTGTITIGNVGDSNNDILVNSNGNTNIRGIIVTLNEAKLIINSGTVAGYWAVSSSANTDLTFNGGIYTGENECVVVSANTNLVINNGSFFGKANSALYACGGSNVKINKGTFNSDRTDASWDGIIHTYDSATVTIGNLGDQNTNIMINSNNKSKISGIFETGNGDSVVINSGTIIGHWGINVEEWSDNHSLYLNGGIIKGIGTGETYSGYSVNDMNSINKIYIKRNANISLSGRGYTGINSMRTNSNVIEID